MKIQNLLEELAELRIAEREIKTKIDEINPQVKEYASTFSSGDEIQVPQGRFIVAYRRVWKYPEDVVKAEEEVKKQKKEAEQLGLADYTESVQVTFKEAHAEESL